MNEIYWWVFVVAALIAICYAMVYAWDNIASQGLCTKNIDCITVCKSYCIKNQPDSNDVRPSCSEFGNCGCDCRRQGWYPISEVSS